MSEQPHNDTSLGEARLVAAYLGAVRKVVNEASAARAGWIRQIGALMKDARTSEHPEILAAEAGRIGAAQLAVFRQFRMNLDALRPPDLCQDCQVIVAGWLQKQMAACEAMIDVGRAGELSGLRATQGLLAEGRGDTRRFAVTYGELVAWLRERLDSARANRTPRARTPRMPWLRGRSRPT